MSPQLKKIDKIKLMLRLDRAVVFVFKAAPWTSLFSFVLTLLLGLLPVVALYLIKLIVDGISIPVQAGTAPDVRMVLFFVGLAGGVAVLQNLITSFSVYISFSQSKTVSDHVLGVLHQKAVSLDLSFYENPKYFNTLYRALQEGPYRPGKIVTGLTGVSQNLFSLIAVAGLLFFLHWGFSLVLVVAVLPSLMVRLKFSSVMYEWFQKKTPRERESAYLSWLLTGYPNAKELRLFDLGGFFATRFNDIRDGLRLEELGIHKKRNLYEGIAAAVSTTSVFSAMGFAVYQACRGEMTVGDMVMFYQAFQRGLTHLKGFFSGIAELYEDNLFVSYFYEFLDLEPAIKDIETPLMFPDEIRHKIEFKNVSFSYPGASKSVLKNVSFEINAGEICAVIGENGAGKSTVAKLLARLYDPTDGVIEVDGEDIKNFSREGLTVKTGVMLQDFAKYHFTASENIRAGNINIGPEDIAPIESAAKQAGAYPFISALPDGFNTLLGKDFNNGTDISQGEWQKIALARVFARDAAVVVLDEPASAMDVESEHEIFDKMKSLLSGKTGMIISHRFATVKSADKIIVLHEGGVAESGTHDDLLADDGMYRSWYDLQMAVHVKSV